MMDPPQKDASLDPITSEVIENALESIADQMALVLMRSAYSPVVRESMDYSTALCDRKGEIVAQGLTTALHLGSFPHAMRHLMDTFEGRMQQGDVYIANDPYGAGGMHLPDIYITEPVIHDGRLEGLAVALVHHTDVGGIAPGSNTAYSTEIFQEGLRIPLMKLYDRGQPNDTLFQLIEKNVRVPVEVMGDLRAQLAACRHGVNAFAQLVSRYGPETLRTYLKSLQDYGERIMRAEIEAVPDGVYEFTDYIDGLGEEPEPIVFHVAVSVEGDSVTVDWSRSSSQVKGGINAPLPFAYSASYLAMRCIVRREIPNNQGYMRPIQVKTRVGTIMNPVLPAACATRGITGFRMLDSLFGALSKAVPDRVPAAGEGGCTFPSFGGYHDGVPFVFTESILGNRGGGPHRDGTEGVPNPGANQSNQSIEMVEAQVPIEIRRYGLVRDTGGAGRYRGGLALEREYRMMAEETMLSMRSDRRDHLPYGLRGGCPGTPSSNVINPEPDEVHLPPLPMEGVLLKRGDVLRHIQPGGGGFGSPLERDPERVLEDVRNEKLSAEYARREYGVVIRAGNISLDLPATHLLRSKLAADLPEK